MPAMYLKNALVYGFCLLATAGRAQSYGLMLGGYYTDLRAAGEVVAPGTGLSMGFFVPFYVNDRLVVRGEAGLAAYRVRHAQGDSTRMEARMEASLTALGRYYLNKKVSLGLGIQGVLALRPADAVIVDRKACTLRRTDLCLLLGAAYRWTDRVETGVRYGQGLLPAAELALYGTAHRRYLHVTMSYLLHSAPTGFTERRKWRSGLTLAHRY